MRLSCNENLHRWEDALNDYRVRQLNYTNGDEYFVPKLRCLYALSDWEIILNQCLPLFEKENEKDEREKNKQEDDGEEKDKNEDT